MSKKNKKQFHLEDIKFDKKRVITGKKFIGMIEELRERQKETEDRKIVDLEKLSRTYFTI